jgi:hypothetical protein
MAIERKVFLAKTVIVALGVEVLPDMAQETPK